jgi:predicted TIM-barrel fold metal-dependent hydrolase
MSSLIIDFHVHTLVREWYSESVAKLESQMHPDPVERQEFIDFFRDPANFVALLQQHQIDYAAVLAEVSPLTTGITTNEATIEFCRHHPQLLPFASINPFMDSDLRARLRFLVEEMGCRGLKLYPPYHHFDPSDARLYPLYETAQELKIPVLFHTGSSIFYNSRLKYANPVLYDDIAIDFPDLKIALAHCGRTAWYDEAMMVARLHDNLFLELSGVPIVKVLSIFPDMERFSHKFIFGTDWPQVEYAHTLRRYRELGLSQSALDNILGNNAARLLGIV